MEKTSKNFKSWRKTKKVIGNYWKILPNLDKTQFESWKNVQKSEKMMENWKMLLNLVSDIICTKLVTNYLN